MPKVSVLMTAWNATATVGDAIDSILAQSFGDFELVVVDDGSVDGTSGVLRACSERDARMRVVTIPHSGIVAALNAGLAACTGELVARMDADDLAHPERLQRQVDYLREHPDVRVCSTRIEMFPREAVGPGMLRYEAWINGLVTHDEIVRELFVESPLPHPSVMMWRADCSYEDHGWPEDYDLWLRCHALGLRFGKVPDVLLRWRQTEQRLSLTDPRYSAENFLRAKAHYLARRLRGTGRPVAIWGAGKTGRRLLKGLLAGGVQVEALIDIDQRKIGRIRKGVPVVDSNWPSVHEDAVVIAAVGAAGAQSRIRDSLVRLGRREGHDFICAA